MNSHDLHSACKSGDLLSIKKAYSLDPSKLNEKDPKLGWTPLYRSVISGKKDATEFLLSKGADPNATNNLGETPLHQAVDCENYQLAELLISYRANVNIQQNEGDTPLHHSAFRGDSEMLNLLLFHKADPNIQNKAGRTPLHYAVDCGYLSCVQQMMKAYADPFIVDTSGKNAFDMTSDSEILECLKDQPGEKLDLIDDRLFIEKPSNRDSIPFLTSYSTEKMPDMKSAKTTTGSQKNTKIPIFNVFPIFDWLESFSLSVYYESFVSAGFRSTDGLLQDQETALQTILPLIKKPGHRDRIAFKIKDLARPKERFSVKHKKSRSTFLKCCGFSACSTQAVFHYPSFKNWLESLNLEMYSDLFFDSGWDDYESLVQMVGSENCLTLDKILKDVKITNRNHAARILKQLEADYFSLYSKGSFHKVSFDEPKTVACESCLII